MHRPSELGGRVCSTAWGRVKSAELDLSTSRENTEADAGLVQSYAGTRPVAVLRLVRKPPSTIATRTYGRRSRPPARRAASVAMPTLAPVYWRLVGRAVPVVHSADTGADVCIDEGGRHLGTRR